MSTRIFLQTSLLSSSLALSQPIPSPSFSRSFQTATPLMRRVPGTGNMPTRHARMKKTFSFNSKDIFTNAHKMKGKDSFYLDCLYLVEEYDRLLEKSMEGTTERREAARVQKERDLLHLDADKDYS